MSGVDVLAVLDEHIGHYAALQQYARDEGNNHYADGLDEHCGTLMQLRLTRAAVAELIEAVDKLFGADMEYCMMMDGKQDKIDAIEFAKSAMKRVRGC